MSEHFDVIVIGGGQAGVPLAHAVTGAGQRAALIERAHLGGSCVNFGCTPTKAALASARVASLARRAASFGVHVSDVSVDFAAVLDRARGIAAESRDGLERGFEAPGAPRLVRAQARLDGRDGDRVRVVAGGEAFTADRVVVNTGTRSLVPPVDGLDRVDFLHAGNWLREHALPASLVVIGGGYIGLEMAQLYARCGSRVTVIEEGERLLPHEDEDVADALRERLEADGVRFRTGERARRVERARDGVRVHVGGDALDAARVFVAVGRKPNTDDLGLDSVGARVDDREYLVVNERLETSAAGVFAAGDVRGGPQFTSTAWDDFRVLRSQWYGDGSHTTDRVVPYAVHTDPELGRVGVTEAQARKANARVRVGRVDFDANGKARETGETAGFVKVVVGDDDRVLGAAVLGAHASELVHVAVTLMNAGASYAAVRDAVFVHPTLSEAVQSAFRAVDDAR